MDKLLLWSLRFSSAWGYRWELEREVTEETKEEWLKVCQKDEPEVMFQVGMKKPKVPKIPNPNIKR
jgi:hypothetical protein